MVWGPLLVLLVILAGSSVGTAWYLRDRRKAARVLPPPEQGVIMMRDPIDNHIEVWTRYETQAAALEAMPILEDIYRETKVFWLKGRPEPRTLPERESSFRILGHDTGLPTLPYLIARSQPNTVPVLSPDTGPTYEIMVPGMGPGPYGKTGRTGGQPWYVAERFTGRDAKERALDALVHKYPPGSSMFT